MNPLLKSAYSLAFVAEYLNLEIPTLKKQIKSHPEAFPPYTIIGQTSQHNGSIVFPVSLFDEWLNMNAQSPAISSSELDKYRS